LLTFCSVLAWNHHPPNLPPVAETTGMHKHAQPDLCLYLDRDSTLGCSSEQGFQNWKILGLVVIPGWAELPQRRLQMGKVPWVGVVYLVDRACRAPSAEGAHNARPAAQGLQQYPPSSGNAADRSHHPHGSHSTAAEPHPTGCDAGGHQLGRERVRGLSGPPILGDLHPFPCSLLAPGLRR
jgi:hypothetical protein